MSINSNLKQLKPVKIQFDDLITEKDIEQGNVILLYGRTVVGKTKTCVKLCEKYFKDKPFIYFNLDGSKSIFLKEVKGDCLVNEYKTSVEIVKTIENTIKTQEVKLVVIDSWQTVEDKGEWFKQKLINFAFTDKIVFLVTSNIPRAAGHKDNFFPPYKKLINFDTSLKDFGFKEIVVGKDSNLLDTVYLKYRGE